MTQARDITEGRMAHAMVMMARPTSIDVMSCMLGDLNKLTLSKNTKSGFIADNYGINLGRELLTSQRLMIMRRFLQ